MFLQFLCDHCMEQDAQMLKMCAIVRATVFKLVAFCPPFSQLEILVRRDSSHGWPVMCRTLCLTERSWQIT
jgi:hypothetical protein